MDKPVIFFSHCSKDKEVVTAIQTKVRDAIGGVVEIFVSSDGQSIPCGSNWIHKVEEGLNNATIMFVFITEASLSSGWIYFEAGFAYSKKIKVIPIGLGIDIGAIKPPLSFLEGFNLTSGDSLNNFITIINREFEFTFEEKFSNQDYQKIMELHNKDTASAYQLEKLVSRCERFILECTPSEYENYYEPVKRYYDCIRKYLDENKIVYSHSSDEMDSFLYIGGITINYHYIEEDSYLNFKISPYNFERAFTLLCQLFTVINNERAYLSFVFTPTVKCITINEDISAIVEESNDIVINNRQSDKYTITQSGISFNIYQTRETLSDPSEAHLCISFVPSKCQYSDIIKLFSALINLGIIMNS